MAIRQRGSAWVADVKLPDGKRLRKSFATQELAEEFEDTPILLNSAYKPKDTSIGTVFRQAYKVRWLRTKNAKDVSMILEQLIEMCGADSPVNILTKGYINRLVQKWKDAGNSHKRINRKLSVLRPCIQYAIEDGAYTQAMPKISNFKETEGRLRYLTEDEALRIRRHLSGPMLALCDFLLYTGCRVGEALRVTWGDVNAETVTFWETKGGRPRTIPLLERVKLSVDVMRRQANGEHPTVFGAISYDAFHKAFTRAKDEAGLGDDPQVVPHVLRHTCASWLVQRGVNIVVVSKWLGHSDISVTMKYAHLAPDDLAIAAQALEKSLRYCRITAVSLL